MKAILGFEFAALLQHTQSRKFLVSTESNQKRIKILSCGDISMLQRLHNDIYD
jgi:hypothetical protein